MCQGCEVPVGPISIATPYGGMEVYFPWELNSTDYLRRVLAHASTVLRPAHCRLVARHAPAATQDRPLRAPETADCFDILAHMEAEPALYIHELLLSMDALDDVMGWLREVRAVVLRQSPVTGVAAEVLERSFQEAIGLAVKAVSIEAVKNLQQLHSQWVRHSESKEKRLAHQPSHSPTTSGGQSSDKQSRRTRSAHGMSDVSLRSSRSQSMSLVISSQAIERGPPSHSSSYLSTYRTNHSHASDGPHTLLGERSEGSASKDSSLCLGVQQGAAEAHAISHGGTATTTPRSPQHEGPASETAMSSPRQKESTQASPTALCSSSPDLPWATITAGRPLSSRGKPSPSCYLKSSSSFSLTGGPADGLSSPETSSVSLRSSSSTLAIPRSSQVASSSRMSCGMAKAASCTALRSDFSRAWLDKAEERLQDKGLPCPSTCRSVLKGHSSEVAVLALSGNGKVLATGGTDRTFRVWDTVSGCCRLVSPHGQVGWVLALALGKRGRKLLSASSNGSCAKLWDVTTCRGSRPGCLATMTAAKSALVQGVALNGTTVALAVSDGSICLYDSRISKSVATLNGHSGGVSCVSLTMDMFKLMSGGDHTDGSVRLWDLRTHACLTVLQESAGPDDYVSGVAVSADGTTGASCELGGAVRFWSLIPRRGQLLHAVRHEEDDVLSTSITSDGSMAISAGMDAVKLWDTTKGACQATLTGSCVFNAAMSSDGRLMATGSKDGNVRLWR